MDFSFWDSLLRLLDSLALLPNFHSAEGVFCLLVWVSTLLMLAMLLLSLFGGVFGDADAADSGDLDGDASGFSVRSVLGFVLGFSWGGFISLLYGCGLGIALVVASVAGLMMFYLIAAMMRFIYGLRSDGSLDYSSLKGMRGTVYVTVPPHGESGGQVQVMHPSQMMTMPAIQHGDCALPPQTCIVVVEASTSFLVVRPLDLPDTMPDTMPDNGSGD